jgi:hypothetical protein
MLKLILIVILNFGSMHSSYGLDIEKLADTYLCYGGGYNYKSQIVKETYLYSEFITQEPLCKLFDKPKGDSSEFLSIHNQILNYANSKTNKEPCPEVDKLIEKYISDSSKVIEYISTVTDKRVENIFKKTRVLDMNIGTGKIIEVQKDKDPKGTHVRSAALGMLAEFCGVSDISLKVSPLWKLKVGLIESPKLEIPVKIMSSGETADSCSNVSARGNEDLENFFVNVSNSNKSQPLTVTYNMYGVKDRVIVHLDGVEMFDSGCVSGSKPIVIPLSENSEKLKITIKALCEGGGGTAWTVGVTCSEDPAEEEPKSQACVEQTSELLALIDQAILHTRPMMNYYWGRANCYKEHHEMMTKTMYSLTKVTKPQISNLCKNKKCETKKGKLINIDGLNFSGKANLEQWSELPRQSLSTKYGANQSQPGKKIDLKNTSSRQNFLNSKGWLSTKKNKLGKSSLNTSASDKKTVLSKVAQSNELEETQVKEESSKSLKEGNRNFSNNVKSVNHSSKGTNHDQKNITIDDDQESERSQSDADSADIFKKNKKDFLLYKYKYCQKNTEHPDLFSQVSLRYCLSAFRWLIN